MGIVDLKDLDESFLETIFSNLDDKDYPYLRNSTKEADKNDKLAFNAFKKKVLGAKDTPGSSDDEVDPPTTGGNDETENTGTEGTALVDSVVAESIADKLTEQKTRVEAAVEKLKENNLEFAEVEGIAKLSDELQTLFARNSASPAVDEVEAEPYESELDLVCGKYQFFLDCGTSCYRK
jgi:hypothetical protein